MKKYKVLIVTGFLIPLITVLWSFSSFQDKEHPIVQSIIQKFENYFNRLPQQKVYLQFDKSVYKADETVWFKAYLVNAGNHKPDSSTTNLYVDLINPSGYIVQSKLIRLTNGVGNGEYAFQDTIPEGIYKIRAFTNWMRNISENFFFEKEIYVANPEFSTYVTREELHKIKKENRKNKKRELDYDVQFLPEGGHLLAGVENRLGYKALNDLGHGSAITGEIIDSKGNRIAGFKSSDLGIGSVVFTPGIKEKYTALVNTGGEKLLKVKIPEAISPGVIITATKTEKDKINIQMKSNFQSVQLPPNTTYFNVFSQAVSERLIFVNNHDNLNIHLETGETIASSREKMSVKLNAHDKNNLPVKGNFSLSIANSEDCASDDNIISNLLLKSDLRGKIENPQYYFLDPGPEKEQQLDDLMLTQGWRRFSWTNVLSDSKIPPKYENEKGIIITGKITREFFAIPLRDIKVTLTILNEFNDVFTTRSGEKGAYRFENLDYSDTVSVSIEAVRANGKHNLVLYVDSKPETQDKGMMYQTNQSLKHRGEKGQWVEPENPDGDDPFFEENNRFYRLHNEPSASNIIKVDESMQTYSSVGQILEGRIPGVMVTGNKVNIRGITSLYGNTDPLFLVDGMPVDAEYAMNMNPNDVERIEVLKGPETAIYGSRGANGVIAIYTKRGKFMKKGVLDFKMLGYATSKEYYNPGFEYRSDDPFADDRRTILWIPTIITDSKGDATATFYTSDVKGKYIIKLEGISADGIPGTATTEFEVK
jgi:TonB-dependent SusC/RagA subfamily outer membrane receptor